MQLHAITGESFSLLRQIHRTLFEVGSALAHLVTACCCSMGAETLLPATLAKTSINLLTSWHHDSAKAQAKQKLSVSAIATLKMPVSVSVSYWRTTAKICGKNIINTSLVAPRHYSLAKAKHHRTSLCEHFPNRAQSFVTISWPRTVYGIPWWPLPEINRTNVGIPLCDS